MLDKNFKNLPSWFLNLLERRFIIKSRKKNEKKEKRKKKRIICVCDIIILILNEMKA